MKTPGQLSVAINTLMSSNRDEPYPVRDGGLWLMLSVHVEALLADPRAYLTAWWSRLTRKRVRSRSQFAQLLGRTRRAYDLWVQSEELVPARLRTKDSPTLLAVVDVSAGQENLQDTLHNLSAEDVPFLLTGSPDLPLITELAHMIDWTTGLWLIPMRAGDMLARGGAASYCAAIVKTSATILYADDDLLDKANKRCKPHFKPDWNSELFSHFDYLTGACVVRTTAQELISLHCEDGWADRLTRRAVQKGTPFHVRKMLHHRQSRPQPKLPISSALRIETLPLVSVIIPTRNRVDLLKTCLAGLAVTDYPDLEIIIVDNDSDDPETLTFLSGLDSTRYRVLRHEGPFNYSSINNRAVAAARGALLCLLNNDIEVVEPNWLKIMVMQAQREDVGAVGARLLYPDGRIQHAGVVTGMGGAAGHAHRFLWPDEEGYFHRHALPQFTSAVTAACLVVDRGRFLAVGGLDERNFAVAFNDVDLCLRLNQRGWQSFYEPRATLVHHESVSRGLDRDPVGSARFAGELASLKKRWKTEKVVDPFHHPSLSRASELFALGVVDKSATVGLYECSLGS